MYIKGRKWAIWLSAATFTMLLASNLRAQANAKQDRPVALRADAKMILVPVTVMDRRGAFVGGLKETNFTLLDEKVPQKIVSFSSEDVPCSIGLVLDLSGSMRNSLKRAKEALTDFLGTANREDEFLLLGISTKPIIYPVGTMSDVEEFTSDTATIENSIQLAPVGGSTALIDTLYSALGKMKKAKNPRRALVVVTDGMDNHSRHTKQELLQLAEEADVQIYTIVIDPVRHEQKPMQQIEQRRALNYIEDLSERTGGVNVLIESRNEAAVAANRIGLSIRNQYLIGFQPGNLDSTGKWHKVQVKLDRDQVNVYARTGYYAR